MMMKMRRVMCVLAVVLCCACGYTMTAAAVAEENKVHKGDFILGEFPVITPDEQKKVLKYLNCIEGKTGAEKENCAQSSDPEKDQPAKTQVPRVPESRPEASSHGTSSHDSRPSEERREQTELHQESTTQDSTVQGQHTNQPPLSDPAQDGAAINDSLNTENQVTEGNTSSNDNATLGVSTDSPDSTNQSQASGTTATNSTSGADSQETNPTTQPSPDNTTTEAPTTTPSPVTGTEISNIASAVKNKANVDSSVSPVWMRTAAPLLIVAVLFSVTVY
ncbi:uncharacterized protein TM35_000681050 [Trypanosoma theileri]|uniref:Mucin TcMUCII n=1 Tax=Trypanosoma theileri TaxID=67003 RepID=A0A1X0NG84_9TRYP|nr:uncharacterized protein TM35_000681050 [Trypanosoma theileri]ORC83473.1 hypothetical protein TM35_000681050 [Trypanosoma theileri]